MTTNNGKHYSSTFIFMKVKKFAFSVLIISFILKDFSSTMQQNLYAFFPNYEAVIDFISFFCSIGEELS